MKKSTDWTKLSIFFIVIAGILLLFSCIAPILFTNYSFFDFTETGQIGDTIGGIMNPFIAIGGVVMTFLAFYIQILANKIQREQFQKTLNKNIIDEKIDCYYKLKLLKLDVEQILKDIELRTTKINEFITYEVETPFQMNLLKRQSLKHYDRVINVDRLSVYKGFEIFLSGDNEWIKKFNNLFALFDYLHEAFENIYSIVDNHNNDTYKDKISIREELINFEKESVTFINNNINENNKSESNEIVKIAVLGYKQVVRKSMEDNTEADFLKVVEILEQFNNNVMLYFTTQYDSELERLQFLSSQILIKLNTIKQKTNQIIPELKSFLHGMIGEQSDSIENKIKDVFSLISNSLENISIDQLQDEYRQMPIN